MFDLGGRKVSSEMMVRGKRVLTVNPKEHISFPVSTNFASAYLIIIKFIDILFKID